MFMEYLHDNYYTLLKENNTSSISLVFDFSSESTLACRLLTVLLKEKKKKHYSKLHQHSFNQAQKL